MNCTEFVSLSTIASSHHGPIDVLVGVTTMDERGKCYLVSKKTENCTEFVLSLVTVSCHHTPTDVTKWFIFICIDVYVICRSHTHTHIADTRRAHIEALRFFTKINIFLNWCYVVFNLLVN